MFLRSFVAVTLFGSLLGAAQDGNKDIFSVRSFRSPDTKEKFPWTGETPTNTDPKPVLEPPKKNEKCAIPLLELKAGKTADHIGIPVGKVNDPLAIKPPVPVCQNWNAADQTAPAAASPKIKLH